MSCFLREAYSLGGVLAFAAGLEPVQDASVVTIAEHEGTHDSFMRLALLTSMQSVGLTAPNPAVGCVLVRERRVIARGATEPYGGRHAERMAFASLVQDASLTGVTAYVTLEPCSHTGKQPPCVELFAGRGISQVVMAIRDPNPLVAGQGIARLEAQGIAVTLGVLGAECAAWHFPFLAYHVLGRPVIAAKWAQTLDGQLADDEGTSRWISGPRSRAYTHWLRQKYDAIVVGAGTALVDTPRLDVRDSPTPHNRAPLKVVLDPRGRIAGCDDAALNRLSSTLFAGAAPTVLILPDDVARRERNGLTRFHDWQDKGTLSVVTTSAGFDGAQALREVLSNARLDAALGKPLQSVFVEGGGTLLTRLFEDDAVDLCHVFIAPKMLGSQTHRVGKPASSPLSEAKPGAFPRRLSDAVCFDPLVITHLGPDVLWEALTPGRRRVLEVP